MLKISIEEPDLFKPFINVEDGNGSAFCLIAVKTTLSNRQLIFCNLFLLHISHLYRDNTVINLYVQKNIIIFTI
jgi:hypothetical protein